MKNRYPLETIENIRHALLNREGTVAVAESVTSGHLQVAFSQAREASAFFQGGVTAYNAGQKTKLLEIEPICALKTNCVSQQIADDMALHANKLFLSHYAIGITGYAATVPEMNINELYAYIAIAYRNEVVGRLRVEGDAQQDSFAVQLHYTKVALEQLELALTANAGS
ncbi:PncC family amidohydrolase [Filimonas zeae]|uniref:CinA C-terminal domain-containing protein n=1 Tax=Filimonas zeae TaxID=1737353 RepID=A0A917IM68_9BACT|nr:nicotinamide-nucleotide amidohydrolase family protein [Filimonas zeae]MDR6337165.1 PncC family amidohydrolase [Filimonas zeae]GGH57300.1 hypothetical protein GCM10011379_01840 [Filimonas zeae]